PAPFLVDAPLSYSPPMENPAHAPADPHGLLPRRICDLGLRLEGSRLEKPVARLKRELERKGIRAWKPSFYLTDEWGCPSGQPIIGIPFYLADRKVAAIERQMNDLESDAEI